MNIRRRKPKPGKTPADKLWLRFVGFRPAFAGTLVLAVLGGGVKEWLDVRDRLKSIEVGESNHIAMLNADIERVRRLATRRCPDNCKP